MEDLPSQQMKKIKELGNEGYSVSRIREALFCPTCKWEHKGGLWKPPECRELTVKIRNIMGYKSWDDYNSAMKKRGYRRNRKNVISRDRTDENMDYKGEEEKITERSQEVLDEMEREDRKAMDWIDEFRMASPERRAEMSKEEEDKEAKIWIDEFLKASPEGRNELLNEQDRVKYVEVSKFLENMKMNNENKGE